MNYVSQCMTPKVSTDHIAKITVPTGGLNPGSVVVADTLDNTINGNYEVWKATQPAASNLDSKFMAIVLNDGFETLEDGRRPAGQPNYYKYTFEAGEVAPVIFLDTHLVFNISADALDTDTKANADVGKFLYATAGSNALTVGDSIPAGTATGLKIVAKHSTPAGGQYGGDFITSYVCVAQ